MATDAETLAASKRSFIIAPAGCGKTELIARAVAVSDGRSLILTHTNAGVDALRRRLYRLGVPREKFTVVTVDGWALWIAGSFPQLSGLTDLNPKGEGWKEVRTAAAAALEHRAIKRVVTLSYSGVYVDEYQDCSQEQHEVVRKLAELMPCRLLGDPLQAIFDFKGQKLVDWKANIEPDFARLPDLVTPHRWATTNPTLGRWVMDIRESLLSGEPIDLAAAPITLAEASDGARRSECWRLAEEDGSVVVLDKWAKDCHRFASQMDGSYTSMEELDCKDLMAACRRLLFAPEGLPQFSKRCLRRRPDPKHR